MRTRALLLVFSVLYLLSFGGAMLASFGGTAGCCDRSSASASRPCPRCGMVGKCCCHGGKSRGSAMVFRAVCDRAPNGRPATPVRAMSAVLAAAIRRLSPVLLPMPVPFGVTPAVVAPEWRSVPPSPPPQTV
jgi:hypothetical protein